MRAITRRRMYNSPSPGDSPVDEKVEKAEENEGDEGHHQEELRFKLTSVLEF